MEEIKQMATREGFLEVFWRKVQGYRGIGRQDTFRQVFDEMERRYEQEYGRSLWPSYEAFKMYLYRHN